MSQALLKMTVLESIVYSGAGVTERRASGRFAFYPDLLRVINREVSARGLGSCKVIGYIEMRMNCNRLPYIFHAHPWYGGRSWYDWGYVEYVEYENDDSE